MNEVTRKSFRDLIDEIRSGSQDAAWELVEQYGPHVQRFVRRTLHQQLRSKFDSLDFMQIVWASLFRQPEKLLNLSRPEEFIALLAGMAKNKVLTEVRRRLQTEKYNVGREMRFDRVDAAQTDFAAPTPTPSAVAIAHERWDRLLEGQKPNVRSIVSLRLQGNSFVEIANQLQIHERTARKAIEKLIGEDVDSCPE